MNRLRIGVIGAGLWGGNHAHTFNVLPETDLVASAILMRAGR